MKLYKVEQKENVPPSHLESPTSTEGSQVPATENHQLSRTSSTVDSTTGKAESDPESGNLSGSGTKSPMSSNHLDNSVSKPIKVCFPSSHACTCTSCVGRLLPSCNAVTMTRWCLSTSQ
ncbi:UNVERIFIED_CONTAM: hypothetical protein FKN15_011470 [Acipenser sinensis]